MSTNLIREKVYKLLYEEYQVLYGRILQRARNVQEYGKGDDAMSLITSIVDTDKYDHCGLQSKQDTKMVQTLQYLINDERKVE